MWFLPLSPRYGESWFVPFLARLLEGDPATLALLRTNPFPDRPPTWVRARLFRYRYTTWDERRRDGRLVGADGAGPFAGPMRLRSAGRRSVHRDLAAQASTHPLHGRAQRERPGVARAAATC